MQTFLLPPIVDEAWPSETWQYPHPAVSTWAEKQAKKMWDQAYSPQVSFLFETDALSGCKIGRLVWYRTEWKLQMHVNSLAVFIKRGKKRYTASIYFSGKLSNLVRACEPRGICVGNYAIKHIEKHLREYKELSNLEWSRVSNKILIRP